MLQQKLSWCLCCKRHKSQQVCLIGSHCSFIKHNHLKTFTFSSPKICSSPPCYLLSPFCTRDILQNKSSMEKEKIGWHRNSGEWQWDKSNKGFPLSHWLPLHILLLYRHNHHWGWSCIVIIIIGDDSCVVIFIIGDDHFQSRAKASSSPTHAPQRP